MHYYKEKACNGYSMRMPSLRMCILRAYIAFANIAMAKVAAAGEGDPQAARHWISAFKRRSR